MKCWIRHVWGPWEWWTKTWQNMRGETLKVRRRRARRCFRCGLEEEMVR